MPKRPQSDTFSFGIVVTVGSRFPVFSDLVPAWPPDPQNVCKSTSKTSKVFKIGGRKQILNTTEDSHGSIGQGVRRRTIAIICHTLVLLCFLDQYLASTEAARRNARSA